MTAERMAALHASAFVGQRGWTAAEIRALLDAPGVVAADDSGGFALARAVVDEAELLTIAVDPAARRRGIARRLLAAVESRVVALDARRMFLEVAADNVAAIALYSGAGYAECGRRQGYYRLATGERVDALLLEKVLIGD